MKRGLTLIEVLVSLVLLTMIATMTIPFMREALAVLHEKPEHAAVSSILAELADVADRFTAEPESFSIRMDDIAAGLDAFTITSPDHPERSQIEVRVLRASMQEETDKATDSIWLIFTDGSGRGTVSRWMILPKERVP